MQGQAGFSDDMPPGRIDYDTVDTCVRVWERGYGQYSRSGDFEPQYFVYFVSNVKERMAAMGNNVELFGLVTNGDDLEYMIKPVDKSDGRIAIVTYDKKLKEFQMFLYVASCSYGGMRHCASICPECGQNIVC